MVKKQFNVSSLSSGVFIPLMIVAGLALGFFAVRPQFKKLQGDRDLLRSKQDEKNDRESSLLSIKKLLSDVENNQSQLSSLNNALPDSPDIPGLLANLEYLAIQSGLTLSDIQIEMPKTEADPGVEATKNEISIIGVDISLSGQYSQLFALLLNLEQNQRIFDIKNIQFSEPDTGANTRSFDLSLKTYFQKNN